MNATGEWIVIFDTTDRTRFAMAKGLIEDSGIPFLVQGQIGTLIQDLNGFLHKRISIEVPRELEAEAREVLAPILGPVPSD
jgi:hypothetical protein